MKLNIFHTPVRCPACLQRHNRADCATCEGTGWLPLSQWMDMLSDGGVQEIEQEAQEILRQRGLSRSRAGGYLSLDEAAERKGVHRLTINKILNEEPRRAAIFPGARRIGSGTRSTWQIPITEVDAWQPRKDKRRTD